MKRMSSHQELVEFNRQFNQCDEDEARELQAINHIKRTDRSTPGVASTNLTDCADECPCHAVRARYYVRRREIGSAQDKAMVATAAGAIANLEHLAIARRSRSCPYTAEEYDAAVAKVGTKKELIAAELGVDRKTLRKYGRPQ